VDFEYFEGQACETIPKYDPDNYMVLIHYKETHYFFGIGTRDSTKLGRASISAWSPLQGAGDVACHLFTGEVESISLKRIIGLDSSDAKSVRCIGGNGFQVCECP
jgi:hypothetical protein